MHTTSQCRSISKSKSWIQLHSYEDKHSCNMLIKYRLVESVRGLQEGLNVMNIHAYEL